MNKCSICGKEDIEELLVCAKCNGSGKDVTVGSWLKNLLLFLIPVYGWFIRIFVLAVSAKVNPSIRNWARAQLIFMLIFTAIATICTVFLYPYFSQWLVCVGSMLGVA